MGRFDLAKPDAGFAVAVQELLKPWDPAGWKPRRHRGDGSRHGDGEQESARNRAGCGKAGVSHLMCSYTVASGGQVGLGSCELPGPAAPAVAEGPVTLD